MTAPRPHLDALVESMHGHRKKTLFFIDCLTRHASASGRSPSGLSVLELGCGNGTVVSLPVAEQGFDVTGVDVHEPSIEAARLRNDLGNARFLVADAGGFQTDRKFDAVILSDVLEHVDDPHGVLRHAVDMLYPDGLVLISVPNGRGPFELEQQLVVDGPLRPLVSVAHFAAISAARVKRAIQGKPWPPHEEPRPAYNFDSPHVQFFTRASLASLLADSKLEVVRTANGAWVGGDLTYYAFYFVPRLVPLSLAVADRVPPRFASSWHLACRPARTA